MSQRFDLLQKEPEHQSSEVDIVFKCWAVADRLGLHKVAAHCEWAMAHMWVVVSVRTRAALELSPGAVRRIARNMRARIDAGHKELLRALPYAEGLLPCSSEGIKRKLVPKLENVHWCLTAAAPACTMTRWRISEESTPSTWRQTVGAVVTWLGCRYRIST